MWSSVSSFRCDLIFLLPPTNINTGIVLHSVAVDEVLPHLDVFLLHLCSFLLSVMLNADVSFWMNVLNELPRASFQTIFPQNISYLTFSQPTRYTQLVATFEQVRRTAHMVAAVIIKKMARKNKRN